MFDVSASSPAEGDTGGPDTPRLTNNVGIANLSILFIYLSHLFILFFNLSRFPPLSQSLSHTQVSIPAILTSTVTQSLLLIRIST